MHPLGLSASVLDRVLQSAALWSSRIYDISRAQTRHSWPARQTGEAVCSCLIDEKCVSSLL